MANNRMWMQCKCGERQLLAKDFGRRWRSWIRADERDLQQFMDLHQYCGDEQTTVLAIASSTHFNLVYDHVPLERVVRTGPELPIIIGAPAP